MTMTRRTRSEEKLSVCVEVVAWSCVLPGVWQQRRRSERCVSRGGGPPQNKREWSHRP